jgi:hypothetical protein
MDWRTIIKSNILKVIVSSILVFLSLIVFKEMIFPNYIKYLIDLLGTQYIWIIIIIPIILITAILNKDKDLKISILIGIVIGIIAGIFFLVYLLNTIYDYDKDWGLLIAVNIYATLAFIISSIIGVVTSYLIRKQIERMKTTSK